MHSVEERKASDREKSSLGAPGAECLITIPTMYIVGSFCQRRKAFCGCTSSAREGEKACEAVVGYVATDTRALSRTKTGLSLTIQAPE